MGVFQNISTIFSIFCTLSILSVYLSVYLSVCLSVYSSIYLSVSLVDYLSLSSHALRRSVRDLLGSTDFNFMRAPKAKLLLFAFFHPVWKERFFFFVVVVVAVVIIIVVAAAAVAASLRTTLSS